MLNYWFSLLATSLVCLFALRFNFTGAVSLPTLLLIPDSWHGGWGVGLPGLVLTFGYCACYFQTPGRGGELLHSNANLITVLAAGAALTLTFLSWTRSRTREELRRAEENYRDIFENAVEGIFQSTPDGRFISVNPAMARMFGFDSPEQMMAGRTDIERQHYVDPAARAEMRRVLEERGTVLGFVAEVYRRDGGTLWTSSSARVVRDAKGGARYYEGFIQEITDRVRADEWGLRQERMTAFRADVITALSRGDTALRIILQQIAEAMVRHLDAALARVWTLNQTGDVLELQASAGAHTNLDGTYARIPVGRFRVGRIAQQRAPHLTNDVLGDELIGDREWARRERLVAFAGYPLIVEGRLVGVAGMFARRRLQQDTLQALSLIADTMAQGIERVRAEKALRDSERRFRRLIEEVNVGILLVGARGEILLSNGAAQRMLGLTEDELLGKPSFDPYWNIIRNDGSPFPAEALPIPSAIASRSPARNVVMGVHRPLTQDRVWLLVDAEPHLADDGSVTHVLCTFSDITERKQIEEALQRSEEYFRSLIDHSTDIVSIVNADGVRRYISPSVERVLGYRPEELIGESSFDLLHPDDFPRLMAMFAGGLKEPGLTGSAEFHYRHKDGSWHVLEATGSNLLHNPAVSGIVINSRDVTERRQAEEALRRSEERNRAILRAVPDLMFLLSKEGVYLDYHAKSVADLLVPPDSFLGKDMREVLPRELAEEYASCFERAALTGVTQVCEYTLRKGEQQRRYEARFVACDGAKILVVARDITAQWQAEAQRTLLLGRLVSAQEEERARLAREVHDEFAAYLTALRWGVGSLRRIEGLPAPAESELSYLLRLTTQLQHKVHAFAFELSPAELDDKGGLPAALDRYVKRWAERAGGRIEAEFRRVGFDAGLRLPREVGMAIYRATQEALTNVLKHAEARRVSLTLGFYLEDAYRGVVSLIVEDDGVGLDPVHGEGAERGFGLKGMSERMSLLGGTLEIRSAARGTTLSVSVPVSIPPEEVLDEKVANPNR